MKKLHKILMMVLLVTLLLGVAAIAASAATEKPFLTGKSTVSTIAA